MFVYAKSEVEPIEHFRLIVTINVDYSGDEQMNSAMRDIEPTRTSHCVTAVRRMTNENTVLPNNTLALLCVVIRCICD